MPPILVCTQVQFQPLNKHLINIVQSIIVGTKYILIEQVFSNTRSFQSAFMFSLTYKGVPRKRFRFETWVGLQHS